MTARDGLPRPLKSALYRFAVLALLLGVSLAVVYWLRSNGLLTPERLTDLVAALRQHWWAPLAFITAFSLLGTFGMPATPLILAGAAVFGFVAGSIYSMVGLVASAALGYQLARVLGRDLITHLIGRARLSRVERQLSRQGLLPLATVRILPIPFPVANYTMALAGVRFPQYILASTLGLLPAVAVFSYFGSSMAQMAGGEQIAIGGKMILAVILILGLNLLSYGLRLRRRRQRYRELQTHRRQRSGKPTRP